jgi:hypothetical protein
MIPGIAAPAHTADHPELPPTPSVVVARAFDGATPPLGLDQPLALLGGSALSPAVLPGAIGLDWLPQVQDVVGRASLAMARQDAGFFRMPPTALTGSKGSGRTHVASRIARSAGLPLLRIDVGGEHGAERLLPPGRDRDYVAPSPIVVCMAATRCANPIVLLGGVEFARDETIELLASMMDPAGSARWTEEALACSIDLRGISWLLSLPGPGVVPAGLGHLVHESANAGVKGQDGDRLRKLSILLEVMEDFGVHDVPHDAIEAIVGSMAVPAFSGGALGLYEVARHKLLAGPEAWAAPPTW